MIIEIVSGKVKMKRGFDNYEDAVGFANSIFGTYSISIIPNNISVEEKLDRDLHFGEELVREFLLDNRKLGVIDINDSIALKNKFSDIVEFCRYGAIHEVKTLLNSMNTDSIFTKDRKNKYLDMIKIHLYYE